MHQPLRPHQIDILRGSPAIHNEFSKKINILDDRLQKNGLSYRGWDLLNDRQQEIFSTNLFLDGECANNVDDYVQGALNACGCEDTEEELHHHSPVLMAQIEIQKEMLPNLSIQVGANESLNTQIDHMLSVLLESEDT